VGVRETKKVLRVKTQPNEEEFETDAKVFRVNRIKLPKSPGGERRKVPTHDKIVGARKTI